MHKSRVSDIKKQKKCYYCCNPKCCTVNAKFHILPDKFWLVVGGGRSDNLVRLVGGQITSYLLVGGWWSANLVLLVGGWWSDNLKIVELVCVY